jgi:predicted methyltransferase
MKSVHVLLWAVIGLGLTACSSGEDTDSATARTGETAPASAPPGTADNKSAARPSLSDNARLAAVLAAQPPERQARYPYRHPLETLEFFGITPGMTVVEVLPGGGWYSAILAPYLGREGRLIGVDYPMAIWPNFSFASQEFIQDRLGWVESWPREAEAWRREDGAEVKATRFGEFPELLAGTADAVLFIRALHNLNRFEPVGGFLTQALEDTMTVLRPGGIVGVVQHAAPEARSDEWADGSSGYLKKSAVIAFFEDAGFELVAESDINANPRDVPGEEDIVWRLPPSLSTSKDAPELRAKYEAIGESNRMTLLFRKPQESLTKSAAVAPGDPAFGTLVAPAG